MVSKTYWIIEMLLSDQRWYGISAYDLTPSDDHERCTKYHGEVFCNNAIRDLRKVHTAEAFRKVKYTIIGEVIND